MNRQEYMEKLTKALEGFGSDIRDEIVSDYEEHFNDGLANGKTEEQIIGELGSIEDLVNELKSLSKNDGAGNDSGAQREYFEKEAKKTFDDISKSFASFIGTMAAGFSKGAEKITGEMSDGAESLAKNLESAADTVANKSMQFAKDVAESYKNARGSEGEGGSEGECDLVTSASFESCNEVIVEADCADIIVDPVGDGLVYFDCDYDATPSQKLAYTIDYRYEDGKAFATIKKKGGTTGFFKKLIGPDALYVKIPSSVQKVKLSTLSGDIKCSEITLKRADLNTMSGDIIVNGTNLQDLFASTMSGDVNVIETNGSIFELKTMSGDVEMAGIAVNVSASTASGDVELTLRGAGMVKASSVSGDVEVELEGVDGYKAEVDSKSGDIDLYFGEEEHDDVKRGSYTFGNGSCEVSATSVSGDVKIEA